MALLKKGSRNDEVKQLQNALNQKGYSLDVDGIYGDKTEAAVRDYQSKHNLTIDGITGEKTWASINGSGGSYSSSNKSSSQSVLAGYEGARPTFSPSSSVTEAERILAEYEGKKPGDYQSVYGDKIQDMLDQILNREKFSYDFNADPLYQQYASRYQQQGKMAMMDAMGNAAALTGGYGNSYAQAVGQQAYQGYLQGLNDVIPELYDMAYQQYRDEGDKMLTDISLLQGMDESDYGRYRDTVSDYYSDLNYYYNKYNDMSDREYERYLNDLASWESDRAYWYNKTQDEQAQANWEKEYALSSSKGSGGSGGSGSSGSSSGNGNLTKAQIKEMQEFYGVEADGIWGSKSAAAAHGLSADAAWALMHNGTIGTKNTLTDHYDSSGSYSPYIYGNEDNGEYKQLTTEDTKTREHSSNWSHAWSTVRDMWDRPGTTEAQIAEYLDRSGLHDWEIAQILTYLGYDAEA